MNKTRISAVVLARDEEENIERAIKSVKFCDEIIVVDDNSRDNTAKIAKSQGATVYSRKLNGDFGEQRNFGMGKAKGDWILFLDADEEVTAELSEEVAEIWQIKRGDFHSYYIKRRDFFWGRELLFGELLKASSIGFIRLVKKKSGKWVGRVHERFETTKSTGQLNGFINHYPHQKIAEFLIEINHYSSLRAKELLDKGVKSNLFKICFFPLFKFIFNYFIRCGFVDGPGGFVYSFMMSFHSFLVWSKLYTMKSKA